MLNGHYRVAPPGFTREQWDTFCRDGIIIIENGERTLLQSGMPNFDLMVGAAKESLAKFSNTDLISIGLSEQTMQDYATDALVVEIYFDRPIQFNTLARTGEPTQLLIPIDGRHADGRYVFRGDKGEWWFGAIRMADPSPLCFSW